MALYRHLILPGIAQEELTCKRVVKLGSSGDDYVELCDGDAAAYGVVLGDEGYKIKIDGSMDPHCDIMVDGVGEVEVGSTGVTRGKIVAVTTNGKVIDIPGAGGADANYVILGYCRQTGSEGDIVEVLINPGSYDVPKT